jgi:hypothetical protein
MGNVRIRKRMGKFGMNMNKKINSSPCFNCSNRKINCHSSCKEYKLYKFKQEYHNCRKNKKKKTEQEYLTFKQDSIYRMSKAQNKRCAR